jgi:hypothetical protein
MATRRLGWILLLAGASLLVLWASGALPRGSPRSDAAPSTGTGRGGEAPGTALSSAVVSPRARPPLGPDDRAHLVDLLRTYLPLDEATPEGVEARTRVVEELARLRATGVDVLADMDMLMGLVYEARPFRPPFEAGVAQAGLDAGQIVADASTGIVTVTSEAVRVSLSLPASYMELQRADALRSTPPFPVIVTLHEPEDVGGAQDAKASPGTTVIRRRWNRDQAALRRVLDRWFVYAPAATSGPDGRLYHPVPLDPLYTRYQVDFDRIVIEGGTEALAYAAASASVIAGVIVRGPTADIDADLVPNLAHLPVYVVGTAPAAKTLARGGHPAARLTVGSIEGLPTWLERAPRRSLPRDFSWTMKRGRFAVAHWVVLDSYYPSALPVELRVRCLDTKEEPNTVRIDVGPGILGMNLKLNDRVLDLDREVRVVVNGRLVEHASTIGDEVRLPGRVERTIDRAFDVRRTMYFGGCFPVHLSIPLLDNVLRPSAAPDGGHAPPRERAR